MLGNRMKGEVFGFKEKDVAVVDHIVACIHDLVSAAPFQVSQHYF